MSEFTYHELAALAVRRPLTPAEQAQLEAVLAEYPEWRGTWDEDAALNAALRALPPVPVSTNFTTRVVEAAERIPPPRRTPAPIGWVRWLGALRYGWQGATVLLTLGGLLLGYEALARHQGRAELARALQALPDQSLAQVELWQDFDSINSLPTDPLPSIEELAEALR